MLAGVAGTEITGDWLNAVQEEIAAVIEDAGIALSPADRAQLLKALNKREDARSPPFIPVVSMTATAPPGAPVAAQSYMIPAGATGAWAGKSQQIAQWTGTVWRYIDTPNGHTIGLPTGKLWIKVAGVYVKGPEPLPADAFGTLINNGAGVLMFGGRPLFTGAANPVAGDGIDGAMWLNVTTGTIWGPKAVGAWPGSPLPVPFYIHALTTLSNPALSTLIAASDGTINRKITISQISELIAISDAVHAEMFFLGGAN